MDVAAVVPVAAVATVLLRLLAISCTTLGLRFFMRQFLICCYLWKPSVIIKAITDIMTIVAMHSSY